MFVPANLAYAQKIFSLSFEAIKNPSIGQLPITEKSVFMEGIRNWPSSEVRGTIAQKWRCLSERHHKVDAIRNQHPYVSDYVSAKSGKMWDLEKKKVEVEATVTGNSI